MATEDGKLIIKTKLDSSGADKGISNLELKLKKATVNVEKQSKAVRELQAELNKLQTIKAPTEEYSRLESSLQKADKQFQILIDRQEKFVATGGKQRGVIWEKLQYDIEKAADAIRDYQKRMEEMRAQGTAFKTDEVAIENISLKLSEAQTKLDGYILKQKEAGRALKKATTPGVEALEEMNKKTDLFGRRLAAVVRSALVFTVITQGLASLRRYMAETLKTNSEFQASLAKLKGALLTAFQPIYEAIVPALITLMNVLTAVINAVARFFAFLSGKSISDTRKSAAALNKQAKAIVGVGGAASKAAKSLADFDEISKLSMQEETGGGGQGAEEIAPVFENLDEIEDKFRVIKDIVLAVVAGLALWKISSAFNTSLKTAAGLGTALAGIILLIKGYLDAWNEGVQMDNLIEMLVGLTALAVGLNIAFGKVAAAISLIIGGIALIVVAIKDILSNGIELENQLLLISGIIAAGLGISLLTGSWIPLLIAAIAGIIIAILNATGEADSALESVKGIVEGLVDFVKAIIEGDWDAAWEAAVKILKHARDLFFTILESIKKFFGSLMDWLIEKLGLTGTSFEKSVAAWKQTFEGIITFLKGTFTGDWKKVWEGLVQIFEGIINGISSVFEGIINGIILGLNWLIQEMNKISFDVPEWVPGIGGKHIGVNIPSISRFNIPKLAEGKVIPANKEFLAILGDQKSGTNIETPLETMIEAFKSASEEMNVSEDRPIYLMLNERELGRAVVNVYNKQTRRIGVKIGGVT